MKNIILWAICLWCSNQLLAKNYYVSQSGNDTHNGLSPETSFRSIAKINETILMPGDSILFKRGDLFIGHLKINNSGSSDKNIIIGAYGIGNKPIICAAITLDDWELLDSSIYYTSVNFDIQEPNQLYIGEKLHIPARHPNKGYLKMTKVTATSFEATGNLLKNIWDSAQIHVRTEHWVIDKFFVKKQTGNLFEYTKPNTFYTHYGIRENFGFFISGKKEALDTLGECFFDYKSKKIFVKPLNISILKSQGAQLSVFPNCISFASGVKYITIENLQLEKSSQDAIFMDKTAFINIRNCIIKQAGRDGIGAFENYNTSNEYIQISNCVVNDILNTGINLPETKNVRIENNTIKRCGLVPGLGQYYDQAYSGILCNHAKVLYNKLDSIGYIGIQFKDYDTIIFNNVSNIGLTKNDCGAYYGWSSSYNLIANNFASMGHSNGEGTIYQNNTMNVGIYCDDYSHHNTFRNNTIESHEVGIMIHNSAHNLISNNNIYNNSKAQIQFLEGAPYSSKIEVHHNILTQNNLQIMHPSQLTILLSSEKNNLASMGSFSKNHYGHTFNKNHIGIIYRPEANDPMYTNRYKSITLKDFQIDFGYDLNGNQSFDSNSVYAKYIKNSTNTIQNSNFQSGTGWWWTYDNPQFILTNEIREGFDNKALHGIYNGENTPIKQGNWGTSPLGIQIGKKYMLTYQISGSSKGGYRVNLNSSSPPYGGIVLPSSHYKSFVPEIKNDTILVTGNMEDIAALTFNSTNKDGHLWMDNVHFYEVLEDTSLSTPFSRTVLFKNTTLNPIKIYTKGKYRFLSGNLVEEDLILAAYESLILKREDIFIDQIQDRFIQNENDLVYPNPTKDKIWFKKKDAGKNRTIEIFDAIGNLQYKGTLVDESFQIPNHWQNGMYMIHIINEGQVYATKLLIER